jgi:hypothetical protein
VKKALLPLLLSALFSANASALVLDNGYLKVGINDSGALIDHSAYVGIQYDPSGTGNYGAIDFLTPGTPFAFSSLGVNGSYTSSNANEGTNNFGSTSTNLSSLAGTPLAVTSGASFAGLSFVQVVQYAANSSTIHVSLTFSNNSGSALSNVVYATGFDADQDSNTFGSFDTLNSILGQGTSAGVAAAGSASGYSISLLNSSGWASTTASVSSGWVTNPYTLSSGLNDGNGDNTVALAYDLGNFAAGQTKTIAYDIAITAVPEPSGYAMLLAGLGMLGFMVRRRA